ncbi:hypothetical protein [uncultured Sphaerochaeta sp.]|uniref:hypothetical protein n=1 Tax=uncultured Sphaerochaeta sp. TaxID=886478 RepID=UPI002A0A37A1|nr:hypothetical protein [uncultured Sphaerochaeta sp.]
MKKVMMRDFRWQGKPEIWKKDFKEVSLAVSGKTELPSCPLLLAVSDEDFSCRFLLEIAPVGGESGICVYHSDLSYAAVGLSTDTLTIHTSIRGYETSSHIPFSSTSTQILWQLDRIGENVSISYAQDMQDPCFSLVTKTSLPGMQQAISFGVYFANENKDSYESQVHSIRYTKTEVQ